MIQVPYNCHALYAYCCYISSTSDHQALDPRGWGPPLWTTTPITSIPHCAAAKHLMKMESLSASFFLNHTHLYFPSPAMPSHKVKLLMAIRGHQPPL